MRSRDVHFLYDLISEALIVFGLLDLTRDSTVDE